MMNVSSPSGRNRPALVLAAGLLALAAVAAWLAYHHNFPKRGYGPEHAGPTAAAGGPSLGGNFDFARQVETAVVGSPETIGRFLGRYASESGMAYFVGAFQWGDLTHDEALHSLELFAKAAEPISG